MILKDTLVRIFIFSQHTANMYNSFIMWKSVERATKVLSHVLKSSRSKMFWPNRLKFKHNQDLLFKNFPVFTWWILNLKFWLFYMTLIAIMRLAITLVLALENFSALDDSAKAGPIAWSNSQLLTLLVFWPKLT